MKKRYLSILLAAAMLLSLLVMPAAAADLRFSDKGSITHQDSVAALTQDGVINGYPDGRFGPQDSLNRGQACAILTRMVGGAPEGAADYQDVPREHWATGYISFCSRMGFVAGYGNGNFGPDDPLIGSAWSKMVLTAIGYDANETGMLGGSWELGVSDLATAENLYDGISSFDASANVNRDDACQIAYNSLYDGNSENPDTAEGMLKKLSYNFSNSRRGFQYSSSYRIPLERYQLIFGNTAKAQTLYSKSGAWGGNCFGMSGTTGMFYQNGNGINTSSFKEGATEPGALTISDRNTAWNLSLVEYIEAVQISQMDDSIQYAMWSGNKNQIGGLVEAVQNFQKTGKNAVIIGVTGMEGGHAIIGYAVEEISATESHVLVYDCNYPYASRYITLTKNGGSYTGWSYPLTNSITWSGSAGGTISYLPYNEYYSTWQNRKGGVLNSDMTLLTTDGDVQITDKDGNPVAQVKNGQVTPYRDGVYPLVNVGFMIDEDPAASRTVGVWLPGERYTVDKSGNGQVEITLTDVEQSATVVTNAGSVTLDVSDENRTRTVEIDDANAGSTYDIKLISTFDDSGEPKEITAKGTVGKSDVAVGRKNGNLIQDGCDEVYVDGKKYAPSSTVTVSNAEELKAALGSNKTILLQPGTYSFAYNLYLYNYDNLTIRGNGAPGAVKIVVTSGEDTVMSLSDCENVTIENITMGHDIPGSMGCSEGVLNIYTSKGITIKDCDLYGCGLEGIWANESDFEAINTTIRECSNKAATLYSSSGTFTGCTIKDNGSSKNGLFMLNDIFAPTVLTLNGCDVRNNQGSGLVQVSDFSSGRCSHTETGCTISGNSWQ